MFNYHVTVTLEHLSGLARDRVVNSFAFESDNALLAADADDITARMQTFYNTTGEGATRPLSSYLWSSMSRATKPVVRIYDVGTHLDGTTAGSPVYTRNFPNNLGLVTASTPLPAEVALCLSFNSSYGIDAEFAPGARPRARDRGRIYFGPLGSDACTSTTANRPIPAAGVINSLLGAGKDLRDANTTIRWCTWSRKAARMSPVILCSVDDAFDTQRRRGERPIAKTSL